MNGSLKPRQSGTILAVCLVFLAVVSLLVLSAMENHLLNQKMVAAARAQAVAFNAAEAGLLAEEIQMSGGSVDLSAIPGQLTYHIAMDTLDTCQQHISTIVSLATFQNARITLQSAYLRARQPPIPGCSLNQPSHRLWWKPVDVTE